MRKFTALFLVLILFLFMFSFAGCEILQNLESGNCTLSFVSNGGNDVDQQIVEIGNTAYKPKTPVRSGYIFEGWFIDENCQEEFDFSTPLYISMKLYAKWTESSKKMWTVSFMETDCTPISEITVINGGYIDKPNDAQKEGYEFRGWFLDINCQYEFDFSKAIEKDTIIYAKLVKKITVRFVGEDSALFSEITTYSGEIIQKPENPIKEGWLFSGWYIDSNFSEIYNFNSALKDNITLYAKFTRMWTVSFVDSGVVLFQHKLFDGGTLSEPPISKSGYIFEGWFADANGEQEFDFSKPVKDNISVYAIFKSTGSNPSGGGSTGGVPPVIYQIRGIYEGNVILDRNYYAGSVISIDTLPEHLVEGKCFTGWYTDSSCEIPISFPFITNSSKTLYAKYIDSTPTSSFEYSLMEDNSYEITGFIGDETELVIPSCYNGIQVKYIGLRAFQCNTQITSIEIPGTVAVIQLEAFIGCTNLRKLTLHENLSDISSGAFIYCSSLENIVIPNSVTTIEGSAFQYCNNLQSVSLGSGINEICDYVFYGCTNLTSITIPNNVTKIGVWAFRDCTSLAEVELSGGITEICDEAFRGCSNLTEITIPESVTDLGEHVFQGCTDLTSATINGVTGVKAFYNCLNLTSVVIGNNVSTVEEECFYNCAALTNLTLGSSLQNIAKSSFQNCINLLSVEFPDSIYSIGDFAFYGCISIPNVSFGNSINSIGTLAFGNCQSLLEIIVPDSVTSLGDGAFNCCSNLTNAVIGNGIEYISDGLLFRTV